MTPDTVTIGSDSYFMMLFAMAKMKLGREPVVLRHPYTGEIFWVETNA